jgi:glycine dehydrogenase subunit 1
MLGALGVADATELYEAVPERLLLGRRLDLPEALTAELDLRRHVTGLLERNRPATRLLSFLGAGCWQHYVPAVCDEINQRAEFISSYGAEAYTDHGRYQAYFEYASLLAELVDMEAVSLSTYDWGTSAATAIGMATRLAGRSRVLLPGTIGPERRSTIRSHVAPEVEMEVIDYDRSTGLLDLGGLEAALRDDCAAVYVEIPSFLGVVETQARRIGELAHEHGALYVVGVDPSSLGVIAPPSRFGADLVCGELQPLGMHMHYGGGLAGFVATPDTAEYVGENPLFMIGIAPTSEAGEYGFGFVDWERTLYMQRERGKDFTGTATGLSAITAAVYLAAMGPQGMVELGEGIMQRSQYAARRLAAIEGVMAPALDAPFFKEFVVRFDGTTVREVNRRLLEEGILGGLDLSRDFPELGECSLLSVTEVHSQADIDRLAEAVAEVIR